MDSFRTGEYLFLCPAATRAEALHEASTEIRHPRCAGSVRTTSSILNFKQLGSDTRRRGNPGPAGISPGLLVVVVVGGVPPALATFEGIISTDPGKPPCGVTPTNGGGPVARGVTPPDINAPADQGKPCGE